MNKKHSFYPYKMPSNPYTLPSKNYNTPLNPTPTGVNCLTVAFKGLLLTAKPFFATSNTLFTTYIAWVLSSIGYNLLTCIVKSSKLNNRTALTPISKHILIS